METICAGGSDAFSSPKRPPGFASIFMDYLDEISDPLNRTETIDYLSFLEGEEDFPADRCLLRMEPWICMETLYRYSGKGKVFLNIGLTNCLNPDSGDSCICIDACVGSGSEKDILMHRFDLLVAIAEILVETLNSSHFKGAPLSKDVKVRNEWKYKDGLTTEQIIPFLVRKDQLNRTPPKLQSGKKGMQHKELNLANDKTVRIHKQDDSEELIPRDEEKRSSYKITQSFSGLSSQPLSFNIGEPIERSVPKKICVTVSLPGVKDAGSIDVKFSNKQRVAISTVFPEHILSIPLPYLVDAESCKASFDKQKQSLCLEMNV